MMSMEEWKEYRLGEIMQFNPKEKIAKGKVARKIAMDQLVPFCRDVDSQIYEEYKGGAKFRNGDTIMARITPCLENGKTSYISSLEEDEVAFGSTEYIVLRNIENISDSRFVYYLSICPEVRGVAIKSMVGSSGRQRVQQDVLENYSMPLPSLPTQQKIASILSSLDDKIEVNRRINEQLEELAQALFKSWFVDFEPFKDGDFVESELGMIPKGWKVYKLSDFLPIITGKKDANVAQGGDYPFFSCSQECSWINSYSFDGSAILVAGNGDFNVKMYVGKFEAYQRTYVLIPHNPQYTAWLYYAIKYSLKEITSAARGSVIKFITKSNLADFKFTAPMELKDSEIIKKFDSIRKTIAHNQQEITHLTTLRDTLLPKLMSGEVDVNDVEL